MPDPTGRCPKCGLVVPLNADGTVKDHSEEDGRTLPAYDPMGCAGVRLPR
jgi:hypothetical protein